MKVAIAGGGTGGHLFPAMAVAEELQERGDEVLIFISEKEVDALATKDATDFRFEKLPSVGMPKLLSPAIFGFLKRFNESLRPARKIYRQFQPDAVLGMGGFTSTPPILAGRMRRVPTFVHESNAIPGKANRLNARLSDRVLIGFEECAQHFPREKCELTGTPIRRALRQRLPKAETRAGFGLEPNRTTLLIMGGSQGAHGLNQAVIKALPQLKELALQMIHLTGPNDDQVMLANYRREEIPAYVAPFSHRMEEVYSAADCAIARSGAASLSELSHFGLPSLLIPYPFAAENHQLLNAKIFERHGAAGVLEEAQTSGEVLAEKVRWLIAPEKLQAMSAKARQLAPDNAAARVADVIGKLVREKKSSTSP